MDNLFTTMPLLQTLKERGADGTGTVRKNRIKNDPLSSVDEMRKKDGGYVESAKSSNEMKIIRWRDNQVVTVLSTRFGSHPISQTRRWSKQLTQHIMVDRQMPSENTTDVWEVPTK